MAIMLYFEKLSPGLHAKLDAKYRTKNNHGHRFDITDIPTRLDRDLSGSEPVDVVKVSDGRLK
jgi:hypothetical protein